MNIDLLRDDTRMKLILLFLATLRRARHKHAAKAGDPRFGASIWLDLVSGSWLISGCGAAEVRRPPFLFNGFDNQQIRFRDVYVLTFGRGLALSTRVRGDGDPARRIVLSNICSLRVGQKVESIPRRQEVFDLRVELRRSCSSVFRMIGTRLRSIKRFLITVDYIVRWFGAGLGSFLSDNLKNLEIFAILQENDGRGIKSRKAYSTINCEDAAGRHDGNQNR
jgi:hypothetical protein